MSDFQTADQRIADQTAGERLRGGMATQRALEREQAKAAAGSEVSARRVERMQARMLRRAEQEARRKVADMQPPAEPPAKPASPSGALDINTTSVSLESPAFNSPPEPVAPQAPSAGAVWKTVTDCDGNSFQVWSRPVPE
jgi:hypothetical protein